MEVAIKDLGEIITGNTPSKKEERFWNSDDICFVKPDGISDDGITLILERRYLKRIICLRESIL